MDEPNSSYTTASPFGGPVAPVIVYQQMDSEFKGWYLDNLFGNLWRRQEWEIHAPTRVGRVLRSSARVADRYRRRLARSGEQGRRDARGWPSSSTGRPCW